MSFKIKGNHVEFARPNETIASVAARMSELGISQMPVAEQDGKASLMVHEMNLLQSLVDQVPPR